jgi:hypothetical protein
VAATIRDHPVASVFLLAILVRVLVASLLTRYFSGTLVLDDTTYHYMAKSMAEGTTANWDAFTTQLYWSTASFMVPVTFLYKIFGPAPLVGQLFVALMGAIAAVFVARLVLEFMEPTWAFIAGAIVALFPSQAFWSSMLMKDASVWFALSGLGMVCAMAVRANGKRLVALGAAAAALLVMLSYLRLHTLVVAVWALLIASFFGSSKERWQRVSGALALGLVIPWLFGAIGPLGLTLVTNHGSLEEKRFLNAVGARTAIVEPEVLPTPRFPTVDGPTVAQLTSRVAALEERAEEVSTDDPERAEVLRAKADRVRQKISTAPVAKPVNSPPATLRPPADEGPLDPNVRHIPRGLSVMLIEPLPLPFAGSISLRLARGEDLLWYPLLALAVFGLWRRRHQLAELVFPLLAGGGIVLMYALSEGNVGTAHRHRGEFVWVVAILATLGAKAWIVGRSDPGSPTIVQR